MTAKLTKAQKRVLAEVETERMTFDAPYRLFNLRGKRIARRVGMALLDGGFIERGSYCGSSIYEMRLTPTGRGALLGSGQKRADANSNHSGETP